MYMYRTITTIPDCIRLFSRFFQYHFLVWASQRNFDPRQIFHLLQASLAVVHPQFLHIISIERVDQLISIDGVTYLPD